MKKLQSKLMILTILFISFTFNAEAKVNKKIATFNVAMHCHSCKQKIEKELAYEPGILNLKVDLSQNTVVVTYNANKTNVENIMKAFRKIGYAASPVGENCSGKKGGCLNNPAVEVNTMK